MTNLLPGIVRSFILISCIILFVTIGDASVTWRRVTKPTTKIQEIQSRVQQTTTTLSTKPPTKAPITWKRSTISRRSTDAAEERIRLEESDDLNKASSEKDEEFKELDTDSEIKPLVPGSRPGFWFDSARRKKPSTLLRPGTRRNSLFPTRSSTTEPSTTVSVTPVSVTPRTLPEVLNSPTKNVSTRLFGRNRSTKSPITFRRRVKTTETPKSTATAEIIDLDDVTKDDMIEDSGINGEKEEEIDSTKQMTNTDEEYDDIKPKRPNFNARRRRPYNGTRLSWSKKRILKTTTAVPQQLTTTPVSTSSTEDYEINFQKTTKLPRIRIKSKTNSTIPFRSRIKQTVTKSVSSTIKNEKLKERISSSDLGKLNNSSNVSNDTGPERNLEEEIIEEKIENLDEIYGTRHSSTEQRKSKARTTVEPFYITKEYGMVATAVEEVTKNYGSKEPISTPTPDDEEYDVTELKKYQHPVEVSNISSDKEKKRTRNQATNTSKITTSFIEKSQNFEKENDYNDDNDASFEYIDGIMSKETTTESSTPPTTIDEEWTEKRRDPRTTTTLRPVTFPVLPTIDSNSNAYVVWSVGHGGSGWSYQKHGGKVKWSAQNSEAEGDSWSVESKDEEDNEANYRWPPVRNPLNSYKNHANAVKNTKEKLIPLKEKEDTRTNAPVTYIPKLTFENETLLNFKKDTEYSYHPYHIINNSFTDSNQPSKVMYSNNATSSISNFPQISLQETQPVNYASQTPAPFYPTVEDHFNSEVNGIINGYPITSDHPYVAEIRETFNPPLNRPTNIPTTRLYEFQEYITQNVDASQEKIPPSTPQEDQFVQVPQANLYPTSIPQTEVESSYTYSSKHSNENTNTDQYPKGNVPQQSYQSSIPPELAKAVVKAKKWRVIGNGGNEGWSLFNEDGALEWKIHNVDGHWRVTSAEELAKYQLPLQTGGEARDDDRSQTELNEANDPVQENPPRVWRLEDDYAKWKVVSSENGIATDKSPEGLSPSSSSSSSEEYDYDSEELNDSYYPSDDYDNFEPHTNPDAISYPSIDGNRGRPFWANDEQQLIHSHLQNTPFSGTIEIANSRDDAVAAWKSLLAQHGNWKISDGIDERNGQHLRSKVQQIPQTIQNPARKVSTALKKHKNNLREQNTFSEIISDKYESDKHYQRRDREDDSSVQNEHNFPTHFNQYDNTPQLRTRGNLNYNGKGQSAEDYPEVPNNYEDNYDSLPESTEQNFNNYENKKNSEEYDVDTKQKNYQEQEKNKFYELEAKVSGHRFEDQQQTRDRYRQRERINPESSKNNVEQNGSVLKNHHKQYHPHSPIKNNDELHVKIPERSTEQVYKPDIHLKHKDHSKLEYLINKLEAIQREAKGRAVIDITALLNQMKARRNFTFDHSNLNNEQKDGVVKHHNRENAANIESVDTDLLSKKKNHENLEKIGNSQKDVHYEAEKENINQYQINTRHYNNENTNKENSVRSQNHGIHRVSQSNKSKRKRRPTARIQTTKINNLPTNQTISYSEKPNFVVKEYEHDNYKMANTVGKARSVFNEAEKKQSLSTHAPPQLNSKVRNSESSSSEEFIVDLRKVEKNKPSVPGRKKRPSRKRSRRPHQPAPIVMKTETEVEDETGSKKSRKIIVIDYAGTQQKRNPVDKKDLELIIRNVKSRRSEVREDKDES